jgi:hypothetical protein
MDDSKNIIQLDPFQKVVFSSLLKTSRPCLNYYLNDLQLKDKLLCFGHFFGALAARKAFKALNCMQAAGSSSKFTKMKLHLISLKT